MGLGNPGPAYTRTRHNFGARVVDALRQDLNLPAFRRETGMHARVAAHPSRILAIPTTFMNTSGRAIEALLKRTRLPRSQLLVVHDDKDLSRGTLKLQFGRSSAGHRGVQSIIDAGGTNAFWRLRIGLGAPPSDTPTDEYVLATFSREEERMLKTSIVPRAVELLVRHTAGKAQRDGA